jgi:hypothetical protein
MADNLFVEKEANGQDDVAHCHAEHGDDQHHLPVEPGVDFMKPFRPEFTDRMVKCEFVIVTFYVSKTLH